jgi:hypothetical protein
MFSKTFKTETIMYETANLLTWDIEILRQVSIAIEAAIRQVGGQVKVRERLIHASEDISLSLLSDWESQIESDQLRLENLLAAKIAITGVLRAREKEEKELMQ